MRDVKKAAQLAFKDLGSLLDERGAEQRFEVLIGVTAVASPPSLTIETLGADGQPHRRAIEPSAYVELRPAPTPTPAPSEASVAR